MKAKRLFIALCILIAAILISPLVFPTVRLFLARTSGFVYTTINYGFSTYELTFSEYASVISKYTLIYQDKNGEILNITIRPKNFPVVVDYDSNKGN